ncbi:MAG TPA: hypothetical protein GX708_04860 [Gallicola sp.]|nr:hypothetical protein [Gallicola sp.]
MKNLTTLTSRRKEILMKVLELGLEKYDEEEYFSKTLLEEAIKDTVEHIEELKEIIILSKKILDLCEKSITYNKKLILNNEKYLKEIENDESDISKNLCAKLNKLNSEYLKEIESDNKRIIDEKKMIDFNTKWLEEEKENIIRYKYQLDNFVDIEETKEDLELLKKDINDIPNSLFDMEEINKLLNGSKN